MTIFKLTIHNPVSLIWNYWPFCIIFITPIRVILNIIFSPINFFLWWIPIIWNFVMETLCWAYVMWFDLVWGFAILLGPLSFIVTIPVAITYDMLCMTLPTMVLIPTYFVGIPTLLIIVYASYSIICYLLKTVSGDSSKCTYG